MQQPMIILSKNQVILMRFRQKQTLLRLEKISEASSPSPRKQKKQEKNQIHRINPLVIANHTPHREYPSYLDDHNQHLVQIQEDIMDRKHRLGLWEDAQNRRLTHDNDLELLIRRIVKGVKIIGKESKISVSLLKALKKGKKGVMQWILCWIRQLFWLISMILSQRHLRKH